MRTLRIGLGLPWYDGADKDCVGAFLVFQHFLGRLQERLWYINRTEGLDGHKLGVKIPPIDPANPFLDTDFLHGTDLQFVICDAIGYSLPGTARERCIDLALAYQCDYILFYDADMIFTADVFLKLLKHELPVVSALAFTARTPITPVIYKFTPNADGSFQSDPILNYKRDALQKVDAVGFGVILMQASVFRKVPKPWFSSPGVGEDIQFAAFCKRAGVDIYVDTSAKTVHKPRYAPEWHDEEMFLRDRAKDIFLSNGQVGPVPMRVVDRNIGATEDLRTEEEKEMGDEA